MRNLRFAAYGCLLVLNFVLVLLIGGLWWRDFAARRLLDEEISTLRQQNEPVSFRELIESRDQDSRQADQIIAAARDIPPLPDIAIDLVREDWQPDSNEELTDVRNALRSHLIGIQPKLQEMQAVAQRGNVTFSYDPDELVPVAVVLPHIDALRNLSATFAARDNLALRDDDTTEVVRVVRDRLEMAGLFHAEPFIVVQAVRCEWLNKSFDLLRRSLSQMDLSDADFQSLDQLLARSEGHTRMDGALRGERAALFTTIENIGTPQAAEFLESMAVLDAGNVTRMVGAPRWKSFLWGSYLNRPNRFVEQAFVLRRMSETVNTIDLTGPAGIETYWRLDDATRQDLEALPICKLLFPATSFAHTVSLECRQQLRFARLALRITRYRNREGQLPEALADAVEPEEQDLLRGLFSGGPVSYVAEEHGFMIGDSHDWQGHQLEVEFAVELE